MLSVVCPLQPSRGRRNGIANLFLYRSMRRSLWRLKTLVSGSDTTRGLVPTTCTRSTVNFPVLQLWRACTRIGCVAPCPFQVYPHTSQYLLHFILPSTDTVLQILRVVKIEKKDDVCQSYIKQLLGAKLKFPLPHRVQKFKSTFVTRRPMTFCWMKAKASSLPFFAHQSRLSLFKIGCWGVVVSVYK